MRPPSFARCSAASARANVCMILSPGWYCATPMETVSWPICCDKGSSSSLMLLAQTVGYGDGARKIRVPQNLDELLAPVAAEHVDVAHPALHRMREHAQHVIAREVPQLSLNRLK